MNGNEPGTKVKFKNTPQGVKVSDVSNPNINVRNRLQEVVQKKLNKLPAAPSKNLYQPGTRISLK